MGFSQVCKNLGLYYLFSIIVVPFVFLFCGQSNFLGGQWADLTYCVENNLLQAGKYSLQFTCYLPPCYVMCFIFQYVHRNLCAKNIMITFNNKAKVGDFGQATDLPRIQESVHFTEPRNVSHRILNRGLKLAIRFMNH